MPDKKLSDDRALERSRSALITTAYSSRLQRLRAKVCDLEAQERAVQQRLNRAATTNQRLPLLRQQRRLLEELAGVLIEIKGD